MRSLLNILHRKSGDMSARSRDMRIKSSEMAAESSDFSRKSSDMGAEFGDFFGKSSDMAGEFSDFSGKSSDFGGEFSDFFGKSSDMAAESSDFSEKSGDLAAASGDIGGKSGDMSRKFLDFFGRLGDKIRRSFDLRAAWEAMRARRAKRQEEFDSMFAFEYGLDGETTLAETFRTKREHYLEARALLDLQLMEERPRLQMKYMLAMLLAFARGQLGLWRKVAQEWVVVACAVRERAAGSPMAPRAPPAGASLWSIC
ncbi:MAG TPA: hypothetical protein PLN54_06650 [Flavobacteriales bacterium]|nr:hypothetical protein [Flavobacteriales bacterium]